MMPGQAGASDRLEQHPAQHGLADAASNRAAQQLELAAVEPDALAHGAAVEDDVENHLLLHGGAVDRAGTRRLLRGRELELQRTLAFVAGGDARELLARALLAA